MNVSPMRLATVVLFAAAVTSGAVAQSPSRQADLDRYQASLDSLVPALLVELGTPGAAVALLLALEEKLGTDFTPRMHAAWREAYQMLAQTMVRHAIRQDG